MALSHRRSGLATAILLACAACSGPSAQQKVAAFEAEGRAQHPDSEWILGLGEGDTRAAAETAARASAAALVKSRIQQHLAATEEERSTNGRGSVERRIVNEVASDVDTAFGAYFKATDARQLGGRWHAMAAASRAELDAAIEAEAARRTARAEAAWGRIAAGKGWLAVAPGWCEARAAADALDALDAQRHAVSGKSVWTVERRERWRAVQQRFAEAKTRLLTVVAPPPGGPAPDPAAAIVAALQAAGWRAEKSAPACAGDVALVVEPKVESACRRSSLGVEVCTASLVLEGRACGGGALFTERSAPASATNGTDPEAALRHATGQIAVQPVIDRARARLLAAIGETCAAAQR